MPGHQKLYFPSQHSHTFRLIHPIRDEWKHHAKWYAKSAVCVSISICDCHRASLLRPENRLQHHWHPERLVNDSQNISEGQRQMAFQNWVAYGRPQSSDVSAKENLMCPLLWCRSNFTNLASTLKHVATCPYLSDGWYWCPHCCRPEQFVYVERSCGEVRSCIPQRKGSKLKRAVDFFKHLGLKKCPKSCRPAKRFRSSNSGYEHSSKQTYGQLETSELADTSPGPAELPSDSRNEYKFWPDFTVEEGQTYEMEQPPPYSSTTISVKVNEPVSERQTEARSGPVSRETNDDLRRVSPFFHNDDAELRDFTEIEMLFSPISDVQDSLYHVDTPDLTPKNLSKEVNPLRVPSVAMPWLGSIHSDRRQAPICDDPVAASTSTQDPQEIESRFAWKPTLPQIEELRDLVHIINFEWFKRLDSAPDFRVPYPDYYIRSLFETGIQVLQRCYQNILPTTFKEVFALMHIACGVFYIRHGHDTCYGWGALFQDFLRWQYAMREERDIQLLIAVTNQLWRPGCVTLSLGDMASPIQALGGVVTIKPQSAHLVDHLRNGMIIRECSEFLNGKLPLCVLCHELSDLRLEGFECAGLIEDRSSNHGTLDWYAQNHVTNIQEMLCRITEPLQGWNHVEPLREIIANTNDHLYNGSLRCTREVEVWLVATGKVGSKPPTPTIRPC